MSSFRCTSSCISVGFSQVSGEAQEAYYVDLACLGITASVSNFGSNDSSTSLLLEWPRPVILGGICYITSPIYHILGDIGSSVCRVWTCMGLLNLYSPKHWWLWVMTNANLNKVVHWGKFKIVKKMSLFRNSRGIVIQKKL